MRTFLAIFLTVLLKWLIRTDFTSNTLFLMSVGFALCLAADIYEIRMMRGKAK